MKCIDYTLPEKFKAKRAVDILYRDKIVVCTLIECVHVFEGDVGYIFVPWWENYPIAKEAGMCDIPGIPETGAAQFAMLDRLPAFLYTRYIPIDRSDWRDHYAYVGLDYQDQWEYMVRLGGKCVEDNFTVRRRDIVTCVSVNKSEATVRKMCF